MVHMRLMSWAFNTTQIPEALSKELFEMKQNYPDLFALFTRCALELTRTHFERTAKP